MSRTPSDWMPGDEKKPRYVKIKGAGSIRDDSDLLKKSREREKLIIEQRKKEMMKNKK